MRDIGEHEQRARVVGTERSFHDNPPGLLTPGEVDVIQNTQSTDCWLSADSP
jgi:hypothetical protein